MWRHFGNYMKLHPEFQYILKLNKDQRLNTAGNWTRNPGNVDLTVTALSRALQLANKSLTIAA